MFFLNTQPLHDLFGRPYKLHLPGEDPPPRGLEPERFLWEDQAERFLRELTAGAEFWRSLIADRDTFSKPMNMSDEAIRRRVAQMLFEGRIHIYRLQIPDPEKSPPAKRRFPAGDGVHYRLEPASARLMNGAGECKRFQNAEAAYRFVETLNPDETQLRQLTADLDVPGAGSGGDPARQRRALAEALANEQVVVEIERQQRSAPKKEAEYLPPEGPGNMPVTLGPPSEDPPPELHNREWDDVRVEDDRFETEREVDLEALSPEEEAVKEILLEQDRTEEDVKKLLESGEAFEVVTLHPGDKLYGFDSLGHTKGKPQDSMFWLDETTYRNVKARYQHNDNRDKAGIKNHLALPCFNRANTVDTVEVTETHKAIKSKIGPAKEDVSYIAPDQKVTLRDNSMPGGGLQITPNPQGLSEVRRPEDTP